MKLLILTIFFAAISLASSAQSHFVRFKTTKGDITVLLYDKTPLHRDQFLKSIKEGVFDKVLFNRVIQSFVSQGGELDDTILDREKLHPDIPIKRIPAEIIPALFHKKGALGAGRNDNPEKSSYFSQIYFVAGKKQTDAELDAIEKKKGRKFSAEQRNVYKNQGGTPNLDGDYTVFGEIVKGMDVADAINTVPTKNDLPIQKVVFSIEILTPPEITEF